MNFILHFQSFQLQISSFWQKFLLILFSMLLAFLIIYVLICCLLYFFQESLIFHPQKLSQNFDFTRIFANSREINLKTFDNINLNGLLFESQNLSLDPIVPKNLENSKTEAIFKPSTNPSLTTNSNYQELNSKINPNNSKGLIFYLHGNSGSLAGWGNIAKFYNKLGWDVLMMDYRGFGKSEGQITSQNQLFEDNQIFYNFAKSVYPEDKIIVMGFSIGTGMAAKIAQNNNPKKLILQAPYYSLGRVMSDNFLFVPSFLLKYELETAKYLQSSQVPVTIFHGDRDETIFYSNSLALQKNLKNGDKLITLKNQTHMGIEENLEYQQQIGQSLE